MFVQSHIQRARHHQHHHNQQTAAAASSQQSIANNHSIGSASSKSLGPSHAGHAHHSNKQCPTSSAKRNLDHNRTNCQSDKICGEKGVVSTHNRNQHRQPQSAKSERTAPVVAQTPQSTQVNQHSNSYPTSNKRPEVAVIASAAGQNSAQSGNRPKPIENSTKKLDGDYSPGRQMGFKSFQQHYRTATVDEHRARLLTFSETIHRQTTLATSTTVRLRSASLSRQARPAQLLPSTSTRSSDDGDPHRASSSRLAPSADHHQQQQQTARVSLQLKLAPTIAEAGVSSEHVSSRKKTCNKYRHHRRRSSSSSRKTLRKSLRRHQKHLSDVGGAHLELLCSFIEQKISIQDQGITKTTSHPSRPHLTTNSSWLATNCVLLNLNSKLHRTLVEIRNFSVESLKHIVYLIVIFVYNLIVFQWETARQLWDVKAASHCKESPRTDNDLLIDMRHSIAGPRRHLTSSLDHQHTPAAAPIARAFTTTDYYKLARLNCSNQNEVVAAPGFSLDSHCRPHQHQHHHHRYHEHHLQHPACANIQAHQHDHHVNKQPQRYDIVSAGGGSACKLPYSEFQLDRQAQQQVCNHSTRLYPSQVPKLIQFDSDMRIGGCATRDMPISLSTRINHEHAHTMPACYHRADSSGQPIPETSWNWPMSRTLDEPLYVGPYHQTETRPNVDYQSDQSHRSARQTGLQRRNPTASGWQRTCISSPTLSTGEQVAYERSQQPLNKPISTSLAYYQDELLAPAAIPCSAPIIQVPAQSDTSATWHDHQVRYHSVDEPPGRHQFNETDRRIVHGISNHTLQKQSSRSQDHVHQNNLVAPLDQRHLARRLSSIIGSDSELSKRKSQVSTNFSSSSSLSSGTNLVQRDHYHLTRNKGPAPCYQESERAGLALNRRRLNRQASSTASDASFSHYGAYVKSDHNHQSPASQGSTRAHLLKHNHNQTGVGYCQSMQNRVARRLDTDPKLQQTNSHLNWRLSSSQVSVGGSGGGNQLANNSQQRAASATDAKQQWNDNQHNQHNHKTNNGQQYGADGNGQPQHGAGGQKKNGTLSASGKSKSMNHQHSPIAVAATLGKVSLAGAKRRLGFKQNRGLNSLSVHRSEEIFPSEASEMLARQYTSTTTTTTTTTGSQSLNDSCDLELTPKWLSRFGSESPDPKVCFVEGLGIGQIASRQALVSPYLGDIQVSLSDRRGMLEVEIIRVRQLQPKPYAKKLPSVYVKVYLMKNKKCLAKFKTSQISHTLDPLYQQLFIFRDDYSNCVLQIIVWGDYGKGDRKSLMGIVQIHLNDLDMSNVVIGWYKLFNAPSMVANSSIASSSKSLRQTLSTTKLADLSIS